MECDLLPYIIASALRRSFHGVLISGIRCRFSTWYTNEGDMQYVGITMTPLLRPLARQFLINAAGGDAAATSCMYVQIDLSYGVTHHSVEQQISRNVSPISK
jgi:hypothetical protein